MNKEDRKIKRWGDTEQRRGGTVLVLRERLFRKEEVICFEDYQD